MPFKGHTIVDGDGHVIEDTKAIVEFMPAVYRDKYDTHPFFNPFTAARSSPLVESS